MNEYGENVTSILDDLKSTVANVKLNPPLTEAEVEAFEIEYEISLPDDFREFLIQIGNGGDGPPEHGLIKLGELKENDVPNYLVNGYGDRLKKEFPFKEHWIWDGAEDEPGIEEKLAATELGCLALGTDGCGMFWLLVVNGDSKGQIWQTTEMGIQPCLPRLSFTQWYKNWLAGDTDWWAGY
jgi:hypothetical protein